MPASVRARSRVASARLSPNRGCMRLTMSAATGMPRFVQTAPRSTWPRSTVSRRGDATSTNAVSGVGQAARAHARPVLESPPPSRRRPGRTRWRRRSRRRRRPSTPCAGTPGRPRSRPSRRPRVGVMSRRYSRWSRKRVRRRGASRKSSALRVGGVSTTTRSKSRLLVQLVQLLHRHVLLRARERAGDVAVEAVAEDALGLRPDRVELRATRSSNVRLGVEHQRPQLARPVAVDLRRACS